MRRAAARRERNLAVLESHLRKANEALEELATGRAARQDAEEE